MGRPRTVNLDLPPGMRKRNFHNKSRNHYYLSIRSDDGNPQEIPLGSNKELALVRYKELMIIHGQKKWVPSENEYMTLYKRFARNSKMRKIPFELTADDVREMMLATNGQCQVTGIKFDMHKMDGMRVRPWSPSIDRIDSTKGYTKNNCRIICTAANLSINQWGDEVFYALASSVVAYRNRMQRKEVKP